nr:electron transport complex subunit RsxC [Shewanella intestini]
MDKGTLWHSPGGIHPPGLKTTSNTQSIKRLPLAKEFIIPIPQVGDLATLTVKLNDHVLKGQMLTNGKGFTYLPVHAPTSGKIKAIEKRSSNHASGLPVLCCVIEPDGEETWTPLQADQASLLSNDAIINKIKDAGIAGMGGAAFPSHIKLNPASDINLVIINGVECEPFITSDDRLMREHANEIIDGVKIIHQLLKPQRIVIAIEDNKPQAVASMQKSIETLTLDDCKIRVTVIPTKYPSGGEKQLIQIITGNEVPSGAIPAQLGIVVHNVGTAYAIQDAVTNGKPLIERVVTLTGEQIGQPGNYWIPIGTPIKHALQHTAFQAQTQQKMIIGGPMMGYAIGELQVPILKGTNCILAPSNNEIGPDLPEQACIRCGECAVACPALLLPQQLFWHAKSEEFEKAASYHLQDCIECGCCSYVCPSDIPLVEYYRIAKSALKNVAHEKKQAEQAKLRFEARLKRLDDEKQAREAKSKAAADKRKQSMSSNDKDAVALAMARIAAKKKASAAEPGTESSTTANKKASVNAAIERAKAKKAAKAAQTDGPSVVIPSANTDTAVTDNTDVDPKKARVAAAVARAKAKKAAQANPQPEANLVSQSQISSVTATDSENTATPVIADSAEYAVVDPKKARIAAAVARAKAKKAAQANSPSSAQSTAEAVQIKTKQETTTETTDPLSSAVADNTQISEKTVIADSVDNAIVDPKKARIAAAVAKAKAKKLAQSQPKSHQPANQEVVSNDAVDNARVDTVQELSSSQPAIGTNEAPAMAELDDKKARIAAAVAKAKAKKLAQQQQKD